MDSPKRSALITGHSHFLVFIVLAAGIIAGGFFSYRNFRRTFRAGIERQVLGVAELKANELVAWRAEHLADASLFFKNAPFSGLVRQFLERPKDPAARDRLRIWLSHFQTAFEYDELFFLDDQGVERISVSAKSGPAVVHSMERAPEFLRADQVTFVDFHRDAPDGPIHLSVLVPIADDREDTRALGILVLMIDPNKYLYPLINRWPMTSRTAETLIVRRAGDDVLYLNDLKFQKDTALNLRIPLGRREVLAVKAALGQTGLVKGVDYRGAPVLGALQAVPGSPWFLVARMDTAEAFAPLRERAWVTILLIGSLLLGAGGGIGFVWRHQRTRFYREKYEAARAMEAVSRRNEALLAAIPGILMEVDDNKVYTWANSAGFQFFGEDVIGKEAAFYFEGEQNVYQTVKPLFDGHEGVIYVESWQRRNDGEKRLLAWRCRVLKDAAGRVTGALSSADDVTERELAAEALRESERKFRDTVSHLDEGYYSCTTDGLLLDHNTAFNRILGFGPAENMKGTQLADFWQNADDRGDYLNEFMIRGSIRNFLIKAKKASGEKIVVLANSHLVKDEKDRPVRIEGTFTDFTERKRAEEALWESEKKYRLLIETANESIVIAQDGLIKFVNPATLDLWEGYSEQELLDRPFSEFIHPDDRSMVVDNYRRRITNEAAQPRYAFRVVTRNGIVKWVEINAALIEWQGQPATLNFLTDITERKSAEEKSQALMTAVQTEKDNLSALIGSITDEVWFADTQGKFILANPRALREFNIEPDGLTDVAKLAESLEVFRPDGSPRPAEEAPPLRALSGEVIRNLEEIVRTPINAELRYRQVSAAPVKDPAGRVIGSVSVVRDITESKKAEEAIRQKAQELKEKNDELIRFTYAVSHDLKSPLVTIRTFLGYLEQDIRKPDAGQVDKDLTYIRNAADKASRLLDELLELSRIGRKVNPHVEVSLQELVKEALDLVAGRIAKRGVTVEVTKDPILLFGDRQRLVEVFQNLVDNAVKFMGHERAPRVEIGVDRAGGETVLFVRDNGIGIDPQYQPKLFGLFEKLDPGSDGTGIGLALVKRIVEVHGGRIWVESEGPGKGTTLRFTMPGIKRM